MAKKVKQVLKLNLPAGNATPAPPVGPILGQAGINMMDILSSSTMIKVPTSVAKSFQPR